MVFSSAIFIFLFFPVVTGFYYLMVSLERKLVFLLRLRIKDILLIGAGLLFYAWALPDHLWFFCAYILIVYLLGRLVERAPGRSAFKALALGIVLLVAALFYYKYFSYSVSILNRFFGSGFFTAKAIIAPLGISFITFSAISYIVDIYRGQAGAGNFLDLLLYLSFFPKVISGPIVLWKDFVGQISDRSLDIDQFVSGLNRVMIGLAKKLILADTFGLLVVNIKGNIPEGIDLPTAWGLALLYTLQIYFDFSAYSDLAIGLSALFGFKIKENFNYPYISTSISEFWRRWHISLGTWFKEYLYIPLGGNRKGSYRTLFNLAFIFLVTGIWHGAGLGYLLWGALHGLLVLLERIGRDSLLYRRTPKAVKWFFTMFIVTIGWQFFLWDAFSPTLDFLKVMFGLTRFAWVPFTYRYYFNAKVLFFTLIALFAAGGLPTTVWRRLSKRSASSPPFFLLQELVLLALFILAVIFMVNAGYSPFIYFQY